MAFVEPDRCRFIISAKAGIQKWQPLARDALDHRFRCSDDK